jgi:NAD(P)-dependent dehydrogenase (short-subunit alcohol dehydrogenase family)
MWAGLVDLDPAESPESSAQQLLVELDAGQEDEVCWRGGRRHLPSLEVAGRGEGGGVHFRADASYLITGGLGGLGLLAARWMADHGARRLVLAGRGGLPARERWLELAPGSLEAQRVAAVRQLESLGVSVHPVAVDVADEAQLAAFLARFRREGWPPLRGVLHAAGALSDQLLARMSRDDFEVAWRPKAVGAWLLHEQLREEPLDFFVLYSSVASAFGSFGQANYAAGNAFLDALAHHRRSAGLPALSINWGPWSEVGMAARMEPGAFPAHGGIEPIPPAEGLDFLERAMATREAQVIAVRADWGQWAQAVGRESAARMVAHLVEPSAAERRDLPGGPRGDLTDEVLGLADGQERRTRVLAWLIDLCAAVMRLETSELDPRLPLVAMGFDSILVAEVRGRIRAAFGVEVPLTEMLMGASIERVAALVLDRLQGEIPDERGLPKTPQTELAAAVAEPVAVTAS